MRATFTCAAVYQVKAVCETPLRTGGADGDLETVLRDVQGRPFLQGASLAGALRSWLAEHVSPSLEERLLGSPKQAEGILTPGHLVVSDAVFDPASQQRIRPRLRIDPATATVTTFHGASQQSAGADPTPATVSSGGKFDMAHMSTGSKLSFTLTWLGEEADLDELKTVEKMLSAMNRGEILLGGQKTNGFGRVSLTAYKRLYHMAVESERRDWLAGRFEGTAVELPEENSDQRVCFTLWGQADSILIKDAAAESEDRRSYTPNLTENGVPVLPGSSIKGAVRARAELIARSVGLEDSFCDGLFGRMAAMGDSGIPGSVRFEDAVLSKPERKITRIRINKFTGGVMRGGLLKEEPVWGPLCLRIQAPDDAKACALILFALRDLGLGLYSLGSGSSIGRGYVTVESIEVSAPDGRSAVLAFRPGQPSSLEDSQGLVAEWMKEWGGASHAD